MTDNHSSSCYRTGPEIIRSQTSIESMYFFSALQVFALTSYLYLGIYVIAINPRERLNRACAGVIFCMAIWSLEHIIRLWPGTSYLSARLWLQLGAVGWIGLPVAILRFTYIFTGRGSHITTVSFQALTAGPFIALWVAQWQWLIINELHLLPYGWTHSFSNSIWSALFYAYYLMLIGRALVLLARYARASHRRVFQTLASMLFYIISTCLVFGFVTDIALPLFEIRSIPPLGPLVTLLWAAGLTYALVRYKFLTITPAMAANDILTTISDLLILCDLQGKIITVNHAACRMLGYERRELEGQNVSRYFSALQPAEPTELSKRLIDRPIHNIRLQLNTRHHAKTTVILSATQLRDVRNDLAGSVLVAKDISALDRAERALRESQERYRDLVENINEVIFTVNSEGIVTYVSPRAESIIDLRPEELVGQKIYALVDEEDLPKLIERMNYILEGNSGSNNYRLKKKDGTKVWVRVSSRPIINDGKVVGLTGVLNNITDQVQAMEEMRQLEARLHKAQKMEAIGTLAGGVAHDLNNILSGIVSYPDLLLMQLPEKSDLRKPLESIKNSGMKAATIVEDMLTLARRGVANHSVINLNRIIADFLNSPEYDKQQSLFPQVRVSTDLAENISNIHGSEVHIAKTVMNLLVNAFEAIHGSGTITVTTGNQWVDQTRAKQFDVAAGNYCVLSVADDGMGIAPEDQDRIFEPFYTKKAMGRSGTGLGMAVVWGTIRDHGGFIEITSKPNQGARLDLYFPSSEAELSKEEESLTPKSIYQGQGESILVVDDVSDQRSILNAILNRLGYQPQAVSSGYEALAFIQRQPMDLIVLDMIMDPGMDGLDTYRAILQVRPKQKAIIASGYAENERIKQALALGAANCIKKPYSFEEIGMVIRTALNTPFGESRVRPTADTTIL